MVRRELAGMPKVEVVGLSEEKVEETFWDTIAQVRADLTEHTSEMISAFCLQDGKQWAWRLDFAARCA